MDRAGEEKAFIGIRRVCQIAGFSKATIRRKILAGTFPKPVISEGNCVRYDLAEVMAWRAAQFTARAKTAEQQEARAGQ